MAVKKANYTENAQQWNFRLFFPTDNYIIRCIDQTNDASKNGNPMVTLEWEIVNQAPKMIGEKLVEFDGVKFKSWHVTSVKDDPKKSSDMFNMFDEILRKAGYDTAQGWDDENPPMFMKGKVFHAALQGKEQPMFKSPTPEQIAAGKKFGDPMVDPITGQELTSWNINLTNLFGLFEGEVKRPF